MLSRHFFRAKVLQYAYAAQLNGNEVSDVELRFKKDIELFNVLGAMQLSLLTETVKVAERVIDDKTHKFMPTELDKIGSRRLVDNRFITLIDGNASFHNALQRYKLNPDIYDEDIRNFFLAFSGTDYYRQYVTAEDDTFEADHAMALQLFRELISDDVLRDAIVGREMLWADDYDQIADYNYKALRDLDDTFNASSPMPVMLDPGSQQDKEYFEFSFKLLQAALSQRDDNIKLIGRHLNKGWELERVASTYLAIINMAIAEVTTFSTIPERVTMDEYITLAKEFGSDKSYLFVNGILDHLFAELRAKGMINKTGRGLDLPDNVDMNDDEQ